MVVIDHQCHGKHVTKVSWIAIYGCWTVSVVESMQQSFPIGHKWSLGCQCRGSIWQCLLNSRGCLMTSGGKYHRNIATWIPCLLTSCKEICTMWIEWGIDNHYLNHCLHIGTHHHRCHRARTLRIACSYGRRDARITCIIQLKFYLLHTKHSYMYSSYYAVAIQVQYLTSTRQCS